MPTGGWVVTNKAGATFSGRSHKSAAIFLINSGDFGKTAVEIEFAYQEVDRQQADRIPEMVKRNSRKEVFGQLDNLVSALNV
jgi:hypothetical protein